MKMSIKGYSACIALGIALLVACSSSNKRLEYALQFAGNNRVELKKVLTYYKDSGQKYDAARFLIENMPRYYAYRGIEIDSAKAAVASELIYDNMPHGALFHLRCLTRGEEEQVFHIKDGKQVFISNLGYKQ